MGKRRRILFEAAGYADTDASELDRWARSSEPTTRHGSEERRHAMVRAQQLREFALKLRGIAYGASPDSTIAQLEIIVGAHQA